MTGCRAVLGILLIAGLALAIWWFGPRPSASRRRRDRPAHRSPQCPAASRPTLSRYGGLRLDGDTLEASSRRRTTSSRPRADARAPHRARHPRGHARPRNAGRTRPETCALCCRTGSTVWAAPDREVRTTTIAACSTSGPTTGVRQPRAGRGGRCRGDALAPNEAHQGLFVRRRPRRRRTARHWGACEPCESGEQEQHEADHRKRALNQAPDGGTSARW